MTRMRVLQTKTILYPSEYASKNQKAGPDRSPNSCFSAPAPNVSLTSPTGCHRPSNRRLHTEYLHAGAPASASWCRTPFHCGHGLHRTRGLCLPRSEEHTSELQSLRHLVCRLLLEKKKIKN